MIVAVASMVDQPPATSYDEVVYDGAVLPPTHPNQLATVATLFGLAHAPVTRCRVLELGCATGKNLVSMAQSLPDSTFVGIDLSARQIAAARALADELALPNVRFEQMNILDLPADWGEFDYIIAYGVYSWVPPAVQTAILALCKRHLAPNGIAFVSYNIYPGWHLRSIARDIMQYHVRGLSGLAERTQQSWAVLRFLTEASGQLIKHTPELELYHQLLKQEQQLLGERPHWYLAHEHLEEDNHPLYFHEFVQRAADHGLQYVADADVPRMFTGTLPAAIARAIEGIAADKVAVEQYLDFLFNRTFRQSLLCHAERELLTDLAAPSLTALQIASPATLLPGDAANPLDKLRSPTGSLLSLKAPLGRAAMQAVLAVWPHAIPFEALLATVRQQLANAGQPTSDDDAAQLTHILMQCFAVNAVEFRVHTLPFVLEVGERPQAHALARHEAQHGKVVSTLLHTRAELTTPALALLPFLDGSRDRVQLQAILTGLVDDGTLVLEAPTPPSPEQRPAMLTALLEHILRTLARAAILVA